MRALQFTLTRLAPLALVFALAAASPSAAQESHSVRIENGVVYLDGRQVPADQLPESLRPSDHQLRLEFTGPTRFHLDGVDYGVEDGRIVEMPAGENGLVVFFTGEAGHFVEVPQTSGVPRRFRLDGPFDRTIGTYLQVLDEQADQFERIGEQLSARRVEGDAAIADRLREEAEQAAIMVRAFPRVEVQTYLQGIQNRDRTLYDQLMREQRMEVETRDLAGRIYGTTDTNVRQSLTESLRKQLFEIFELKQQNRRLEIAELEQQLRELREQLAAREANREAIVARRLEALIGNPHR